jgi:hypothetical protein
MQASKYLQRRRQAAHVLNEIIKTMGIGVMAETFYGDNDDEWTQRGDLIKALRGQSVIAEILFTEHQMTVTITNATDIIRPKHLKSFNPAAIGIDICHNYDFKGDKLRPDLEATVDIPDITGLNLPKQFIAKQPRMRKPKVIR